MFLTSFLQVKTHIKEANKKKTRDTSLTSSVFPRLSESNYVTRNFNHSCFNDTSDVSLLYVHIKLTPWSRVLLEKLTGFQLIKKFPAFYATGRFITAFTSARQLSLFWDNSIQSKPPHPAS
jgi:hypothetical protein